MFITAAYAIKRDRRAVSPDVRCIRIAAKQHGLITRAQALAAGMTDDSIMRRLVRGHWSLLFEGIYVVGGAPETWDRTLWGAKLWAGNDGYFSGRTGALLNRLDGVYEPVVEMTLTERSLPPDPAFHFRFTSRPPDHLEIINGLTVAPIERVLVDLAAVERPWRVEFALDDALRKGKTSMTALHGFVASDGRQLWGCKMVRRLLSDRPMDDVTLASKLEDKFARLLKHTLLPPVVRHHEVTLSNGIPKELDFAYPHVKVAPETDGYRWHSGRMRWQEDLDKLNALAEIGWLLLKFSWRDVDRRPWYVISKLAATITERERFFVQTGGIRSQ
jgi:very-short-patch-repair endonuclease